MCLAIPGKIIKKSKDGYLIKYPEVQILIKNSLVSEVKAGDWVLVQQKYITQKMSTQQAKDFYKLIKDAKKT